jgi:hypothetical protein
MAVPWETAPTPLSGAIMNGLSPVIAAILFFVAALGTALPLPARAAESYDNCTGFIDTVPASITTPGTWCLRRNLDTAITSGIAIRIANHDVTLDCNHFTIDGSEGGTDTRAEGVYAGNQFNVSIRNCNIRGFRTGIMLVGDSGGDYLVERNTLTWSTLAGIRVQGAGSTIRGNRVLDTGEVRWEIIGDAYGIIAMNGVDVIDNTISGVYPHIESNDYDYASAAYGIQTIANGAGSVIGNRIRRLPNWVATKTKVYGIYNVNSKGLIIRGNDIQGPGAISAGVVGLRCSSTPATARDNVIVGFATAIQKCMSIGNTVNTY